MTTETPRCSQYLTKKYSLHLLKTWSILQNSLALRCYSRDNFRLKWAFDLRPNWTELFYKISQINRQIVYLPKFWFGWISFWGKSVGYHVWLQLNCGDRWWDRWSNSWTPIYSTVQPSNKQWKWHIKKEWTKKETEVTHLHWKELVVGCGHLRN